jgi:hypothetical protein
MSRNCRDTIGVLALTGAVCLGLVGAADGRELPNGPWPAFAVAAFFLAMALACLIPKTQRVTLRLVGAGICAAYAGTVASFDFAAIDPNNWFNVLLRFAGLFVYAIPSAYVAIWGRYPRWWPGAWFFDGPSPARCVSQQLLHRQ